MCQARNGVDAIALALKHKPELIILDRSGPVMDGFQAAKEVRDLIPKFRLFGSRSTRMKLIPNTFRSIELFQKEKRQA